jgi:hypothetical protein
MSQAETEFPNQTPTIVGFPKNGGNPRWGPNTTKKARMEQMGTSDEE